MAGDFNFPNMQWSPISNNNDSHTESILRRVVTEHHLTQMVKQPTRADATLDLVFVTESLITDDVIYLPPVAGSDHDAQLISIRLPRQLQKNNTIHRRIDYHSLTVQLQQVDWTAVFSSCASANDYASSFTAALSNAIESSAKYLPRFRRKRLPRHIVQLIRAKKKAWRLARHTGDYSKFKAASRTSRAALRQLRRCEEMRIIYSSDNRQLFSHFQRKTTSHSSAVHLCIDGTPLTDQQAANALQSSFITNFNTCVFKPAGCVSLTSTQLLQFSCSHSMLAAALRNARNSNSSPDGILYRLLKVISSLIIEPLCTVFRHSLAEGAFPDVWKKATVIALYKGKGSRSLPECYRPISLCHCLGKLLETVIHSQLIDFINDNQLACNKQHGFTAGRSTLTNLLASETIIANITSAHHPYDILSFDFEKAFDKAPHRRVIDAVAALGIGGSALCWLNSFLSKRTFCVRVGNCYSAEAPVTSGVIQGSVLGPTLYNIFLNALLQQINLPAQAYADDLKIIVDTVANSNEVVQNEINKITAWADDNGTPLSVPKCSVMHCGPRQPNYVYTINKQLISVVDNQRDLGVMRCADAQFSTHCHDVIAKANRMCGIIWRTFNSRHRNIMWPAFTSYVLPLLSYCSPVWSPYQQCDVSALEKVQRRYSKKISGLGNMQYCERLKSLNSLSLANKRVYADLLTVYKYTHGLISCPASEAGLCISTTATRGGGLRLFQRRAANVACGNLFPFRAVSAWNKLPLSIVNSKSIGSFKRLLVKHLSCQ
jgi:ribonuclease P/MRP protein subunit RPP40